MSLRIAIITWSSRKVGGTETYLGDLMSRLSERGHQLCLVHEISEPLNREPIALPAETLACCVSDIGMKRALASVRAWQPDVIFSHGLHNTRFEERLLRIAPGILFAHTYYGTCISGEKTVKRPVAQPCTRRFGPRCLVNYYPHRCGGLNPITMARLYRTQVQRLANVNRYRAVVTHSSYMRDEFVRQGCDPKRIHNISYYSDRLSIGEEIASRDNAAPLSRSVLGKAIQQSEQVPLRLLFLGRMSFLKGGQTLLASLEHAHKILRRPLHLTFAGEGPSRREWEQDAARLEAQHEWLTVDFAGWLKGARLDKAFSQTDLLVFPSLWPEPFGLIGLEAGHHGVPIAAFDVGGISDWLFDGINGHLAPGNPPTAQGLAEAIAKCLNDPAAHDGLRRGALEVSKKFSMQNHLNRLLQILEQVREPAPENRVPEMKAVRFETVLEQVEGWG